MDEKKKLDKKMTEKEATKKQIPNRKILYLEIDDEITTIFDRLKKVAAKEIYLVVPKRATLLQSIVNLKILKRKMEEQS